MRAGIALGSNVGDRWAHLKEARAQIERLAGIQPPLLASGIYETEPVGCEAGAGKFLNAVMEVGFVGEPSQLLDGLREVETKLGRPSLHPRNISRTIDLDLLYLGDAIIDTTELQLPHPRLEERAFVLQPLADIRPDLVLPNRRDSIAVLLSRLGQTAQVVRIATEW